MGIHITTPPTGGGLADSNLRILQAPSSTGVSGLRTISGWTSAYDFQTSGTSETFGITTGQTGWDYEQPGWYNATLEVVFALQPGNDPIPSSVFIEWVTWVGHRAATVAPVVPASEAVVGGSPTTSAARASLLCGLHYSLGSAVTGGNDGHTVSLWVAGDATVTTVGSFGYIAELSVTRAS